ncbi:hypothetical protein [Mycobacterium lepromatosis]|nr:hypothetical protein [Mycobacterium lepromatosis]
MPSGELGLLLGLVNWLQLFGGYTDKASSETKWCRRFPGLVTADSIRAT